MELFRNGIWEMQETKKKKKKNQYGTLIPITYGSIDVVKEHYPRWYSDERLGFQETSQIQLWTAAKISQQKLFCSE